MDILQNNWSPIYDVSAVLTSIQSLLCDPNPNSPANSEAARMYTEARREARWWHEQAHFGCQDFTKSTSLLIMFTFPSQYNKKVQESVERSWM